MSDLPEDICDAINDIENAEIRIAIYGLIDAKTARITELEDALTKIEYLDRPQVRGQPRRVSIQEIALAALVKKDTNKPKWVCPNNEAYT